MKLTNIYRIVLPIVLFPAICFGQANIINTICGTGTAGYSGDGMSAIAATLDRPNDVLSDSVGNIYIVDGDNAIRKISSSTGIISTIAGTAGVAGYSGDGGPAIGAEFTNATSMCFDKEGNIYIADEGANVIRKVNTAGIISTIAGTGTAGFSGDGGEALAAELWGPNSIIVDSSGNIFICDSYNHCIREINSSGIIITIAGTGGVSGFLGDGGAATSAQLHEPTCVQLDNTGNLYIADQSNERIRMVDMPTGIITTVAGSGAFGTGGDGGPANAAEFNLPATICFNAANDMFISDAGNSAIRKVDHLSGIITTVAGNDTAGYSGDGGEATNAELNYPYGICVDHSNNLFIADFSNNRIRKVNGVSEGIPSVKRPSFNIFPNPSYGAFIIDANNAGAQFCIYNELGEKVYDGVLSNKTSVDISTQQAGLYFVKASSGYVQKILISK